MAIFLQYGRHRLLSHAFYMKIAAVSQKRWVGDQSYILIIYNGRFNVISSIKAFKYFQDGYLFLRSPPRAIP